MQFVPRGARGRTSRLAGIKQALEGLPTAAQYAIEEEGSYLRAISSVLFLFGSVRLEEVPYLVSEASFRKLIVQFARATRNKEIIAALLTVLCRGFS